MTGSGALRIRVALWLGFFVFPVAGCFAPSPEAAAKTIDARYATGAFSWLVDHRPTSLLVVGTVRPAEVETVVPQTSVQQGRRNVCAQARLRHAAVLIVGPFRELRERTLQCGVALYRDTNAIVVAPL